MLIVGPHCTRRMLSPRKVVLPVVVGVWIVTTVAAAYTWAMVQQFTVYCDFFLAGASRAMQLPGITGAYLRFHLARVPIGLAIFGYGFCLLRRSETSAAHLAWYASVSVSLAAVWQAWAMLAERFLYLLLLPVPG